MIKYIKESRDNMVLESFRFEDTFEIGYEIGRNAQKGSIYCLKGDLGAGKTVFTKGFAKGLDIHEHITSPTFTIVNIYNGRLPLYHFDIYRISEIEQMYEIGYEEMFFGDGVCIVEWADNVLDIIPKQATWIDIQRDLNRGDDYRKIYIGEMKL